jgi:cysteinyl-tRNA synthetase
MRDERERARAARNFKLADELRAKLAALGYEVRDNKDGPALIPKANSRPPAP